MSEDDLLEDLHRITSRVATNEADLRLKIRQVSDALLEICEGQQVHASSDDVTVWESEPTGEFGRGHFSFSNVGGIYLGYCEPAQDLPVFASGVADRYEPSYRMLELNEVPIDWLKRAVSGGQLRVLMQAIRTELNRQLAETEAATQVVSQCMRNPTLGMGAVLVEVAHQIGYVTVVQDWDSAVDDITTDPSSAISRACSLTESVCKHLLDDLNVDRPNDQSIRPLFNTTAAAFGLDPAGQADSDLKRVCGGLATVAQYLGSLRTKFSTAHGRGPDDASLTPAHARLAVNAAGTLSTFLMELWQLKKETNTNP